MSGSTSELGEVIYHFSPFHRRAGIVLMIASTTLWLLMSLGTDLASEPRYYGGFTLICLIPFLIGAYMYVRHSGTVEVGEKELHVKRWGKVRKRVVFDDVIAVQESDRHFPHNFCIQTASQTIKFSRAIVHFPLCYATLRTRLPQLRANCQLSPSLKLSTSAWQAVRFALTIILLIGLPLIVPWVVKPDDESIRGALPIIILLYVVMSPFVLLLIISIGGNEAPATLRVTDKQFEHSLLGRWDTQWQVGQIVSVELKATDTNLGSVALPSSGIFGLAGNRLSYAVEIIHQNGQKFWFELDSLHKYGLTPERFFYTLRYIWATSDIEFTLLGYPVTPEQI